MGKKTITGTKNVYELAQERLKVIFNEFDNIYVSFSGGKDSGVLLNMCIDYIRRNNLKIRLGVFHMDYEIQYKMTIDYVDRILEANKDILDVYRVCVPFRVSTCTSMYQSFWRPWEDNKKDIWVRSMPKKAMKKEDFPFYNTTMWDYEFQMRFAQWLHQKKDAVRTCCLIGIRTQESFNRWRCIYMSRKFQMYHKYRWTSKVGNDIYNAYPIFDWKTTDVWTANGKFQWDYNVLYDLYYRAGVNLERQRVASPFINEAQESLALYRVLDPNTWGKMIGRVNGVNFTGMYGGTHAMGWQMVKLPEGYTWREFMYFLLSTLPERARKGYLRKLSVSVHFWRTKGGCLSDSTIQKLIDAKVADYYERALYNHILGQQDPETGMVSYFLPLLSGSHKVYSTRENSFWCCVGSGFESHAKYGEAIYCHNEKGIYVNLFIPSEVNWKAKGITLRQETGFPAEENTTLTIQTDKPVTTTIYLRYPSWSEGVKVNVNGKKVSVKQKPGSYIAVTRQWKDGDRIEANYPMSLQLETTSDNPQKGALLYGPLVLAGELGTEGMQTPAPFSDPALYNDYYTYDYHIPAGLNTTLQVDLKHPERNLQRTGKGLEFKNAEGTILKPLYDVHHQRYVIYWDLKTK